MIPHDSVRDIERKEIQPSQDFLKDVAEPPLGVGPIEAKPKAGSRSPPWLKLKPIRSRTLIEHSSPDIRQFTEEIALINESCEAIDNFPLPLSEFRDGLKVLDEDSSTLSFYSRSEISNIIKNYTPRLKSAIEEQLNSDKAFLLWISLPKSKEIKKNELRTIKLVFYSTRKQMAAKYSIFSIPEYIEKLLIPGLGKGPEYFYFITAPPDYAIEVVQKETYTKEESHSTWFRANENLPSYYWSFQPDTDENAKQSYMTIVNPHNYISIRLPRRDKPYNLELKYQVKLHKAERLLWNIFLPISIAILSIFVFQIYTKSIPAFLIPANLQPSQLQQLLLGVGAALLGVFGVILSLTGDRLLRRTRMLLSIPIVLSILIIFGH